jgi:predicted RNase H-like nuclease (RuvC/YqgF family)
MDNAKPLTPEALTYIRANIPKLNDQEHKLAKKLIDLRIRMEIIKSQAKIDAVKRMEQADEEIKKFLKEGDECIEAFQQKRKEFYATVRDLQPELHAIEFELLPDEGVYKPMGTREEHADDISDDDEACGLPQLPDDMPEGVKQTVQLLMQRMTGKPN